MFVHVVKSTRKGQKGGHCSLVESSRATGRPEHIKILNFGFITRERIPYLKAAFNTGDPAQILKNELEKMAALEEEEKKQG